VKLQLLQLLQTTKVLLLLVLLLQQRLYYHCYIYLICNGARGTCKMRTHATGSRGRHRKPSTTEPEMIGGRARTMCVCEKFNFDLPPFARFSTKYVYCAGHTRCSFNMLQTTTTTTYYFFFTG